MIITDKVYGKQNVDDGLIVELLSSPELERLKGVGQYGTWYLLDKKFDTTRFEHSFGVYYLLKHFGAAEDERVAGLLHDINHTAFSHVVDYVLGDPSTQEFGDSKHHDIIMNSTIPSLLKRMDISVSKVCDPHNFGLLERNLPDLCCDRIDYCLRDSVCCGFIGKDEAAELLDGLIVHDGEIVCKGMDSASRFARLFLKTSKFLWSNELQSGSFLVLAEAIKIALKKGFVSESDLFLTDNEFYSLLKNSGDNEILDFLGMMSRNSIVPGSKDDYDIIAKSKVRFVDPKFLDNGKIKRLSDVDKVFKKDVDDFKGWIGEGFYIKLRK